MHFSIDRTVHTTAFDKPVVDHWLERKIAQTAAGSTEKDRSDDRPLQRRARYRLSYIPLRLNREFDSISCYSLCLCPCIYRHTGFSFQPVLHDWCNKGRGMYYHVCGMMHIKEPLLLIGESSLCGGSGFPLLLSE